MLRLLSQKNIFVKSKKIIHDKKKKLAIFKEDVEFIDLDNNLQIFGQHVVYKFDEDLIYGVGETLIEFDNRYIIKSNDIFYNQKLKKFIQIRKQLLMTIKIIYTTYMIVSKLI